MSSLKPILILTFIPDIVLYVSVDSLSVFFAVLELALVHADVPLLHCALILELEVLVELS